MGRLTEALRRAADSAEKEQLEGLNDASETPIGTLSDASDDLFPIEIGTSGPGAAELAGAAVIVPPVVAPPPMAMPAAFDAAAGDPALRQASNGYPGPVPHELPPAMPDAMPPRHARQSDLFERLDATLAQKIVVDQNIMPVSREQYRRLAATLHHAQADAGLKVVMIASAVVGEGKTLTASNLALTFSESYKRTVLLIDGDFRRPALHVVFNINAPSGLSEGLMSVTEQKLPLYRVSDRLTILPAGKPSSDPMAGLTSGRMRRVIQEARDAFDWVIIDTPPVGLLPDANLLATMVDGAVLVVRANATPYHQVQRAIDALDRNRLLGVVLNSVSAPVNGSHNYYSYYHGARAQTADPQ
jgi:capsular exopolysaccharide synthesis family protein